MSRWFRHYTGMMRDEKLVRAAMKSGQPVERVVWVWGAVLESAAELNDGGRYEIDCAEIAYFLRADEEHISAVLDALADIGRIAQGVVAKWADRQYESDRSKERTRTYRERQKLGNVADGKSRDADVTSQDRHRDAPIEQRTDTDIEPSLRSGSKRVTAPTPSPRAILLECLSPEVADGVIDHRKKKKSPLTVMAAQGLAKAYLATGDPNAAARHHVEQGWTGFNPDWFRQSSKPPGSGKNGTNRQNSTVDALLAIAGEFEQAETVSQISDYRPRMLPP